LCQIGSKRVELVGDQLLEESREDDRRGIVGTLSAAAWNSGRISMLSSLSAAARRPGPSAVSRVPYFGLAVAGHRVQTLPARARDLQDQAL
jgi:hypothetical protein